MKKVIATILLTVSFGAFAACPPHAPYGCQQMPNGKMLCGCGR
jgi:hypothetical protein